MSAPAAGGKGETELAHELGHNQFPNELLMQPDWLNRAKITSMGWNFYCRVNWQHREQAQRDSN